MATGGEHLNRRLVAALTALVLGGLIAVPSAPAATSVGQLFQPTTNCTPDNTRLQAAAQSGTSYTIPAAGVLTSWSFQAGLLPLSGLKFKLAQSLGSDSYRIVAETVAGPQVSGAINTTAAQIPVQPGQLIGIYYSGGYCGTINNGLSGDVYAARSNDQLAGTTNSYGSNPQGRIPVQATIEPDADKDGFGDETQDRCVGKPGPDRGCAKCKKKKKKKSSAGAAKKKKCKKKKKKK